MVDMITAADQQQNHGISTTAEANDNQQQNHGITTATTEADDLHQQQSQEETTTAANDEPAAMLVRPLLLRHPSNDILENTTHTEESDIFQSHGITAADVEPAVLALARAHGDAEALRRAARVTSVNLLLEKEGHAPLTLAKQPPRSLTGILRAKTNKEEVELPPAARIIGLSEEEYAAIAGTYGTVMGLNLHAKAFKKLSGVCRGKKAMSLRGNAEASLKYLHRRILTYARNLASQFSRPTVAPPERI